MKRRRFLSLLGGAALVPLVHSPTYAGSPDACAAPLARDDGLAVADVAGTAQAQRAALCQMADRLVASAANIHAVLVVHAGKLLFEHYLSGPDQVPGRFFGHRTENVTFDADTLHNMKSVSKSVASLAVGIALDRGLIRSIDQPIFDFFPELSDLRSPDRDRIRLSHVLSMSMGLDWVEATPATGDFHNDEARMNMAWDPCRFVLSRSVKSAAGQEFFYNTGALRLISTIIHRASGQHLDEFAHDTLFAPLGINAVEWLRVRGETDAGGGLRMRPRDMVKIGQLVLAGGRWNDHQIVPKTWIEMSTAPILKATDDQSYGYLWWLGRSRFNGHDVPWIGALGRGGQSIRIVPQLDLVIAVTAGYYQDYSPRAFQLQYSVFRDVVRALLPAH